jgi:GTPase SAR1 family protein
LSTGFKSEKINIQSNIIKTGSTGGNQTALKRDFRKKIYLMGDYRVGKTSLIKRYIFNNFGEGAISRIFARESLKYLQFKPRDGSSPINVRLSINDIGNVRHPNELEDVLLNDVDGIMLICDLSRQDTFLTFEYWLDLIKELPKLNSICLVGNKSDVDRHDREVEVQDLQDYASTFNAPVYVTSAKRGEGVENVFIELTRSCLDETEAPKLDRVPSTGGASRAPASATSTVGTEGRSYAGYIPGEPSMSKAQLKLREMRRKQIEKDRGAAADGYFNSDGEIHLKYGGNSYLIKEERPERSFRAFCELVNEAEYNGLCIARQYPEEIRDSYNIGTTPIYWLTRSGTDKNHLSVNLSRLSSFIKRFLDDNSEPAIILEGLEYLIIQNDFMSVLKFIQLLNEYIRMNRSCLVVPLNPDILGDRDLSLLEREMVVLEP